MCCGSVNERASFFGVEQKMALIGPQLARDVPITVDCDERNYFVESVTTCKWVEKCLSVKIVGWRAQVCVCVCVCVDCVLIVRQ